MGPDRRERSISSTKDDHHQPELRVPRGLACSACRKKKHLCDRAKPFCTPCLSAGKECTYAGRKPHTTVLELEAIMRKLERKYAARLRATKRRAKSKKHSLKQPATSNSPRLRDKTDATLLTAQLFIQPPSSDTLIDFINSSPHQTDRSSGGYHFDESFLTIPLFVNAASSPPPDTFLELDHLEGPASFISHSARDFIQEPLTASYYCEIQESPVVDQPQTLEGYITEISSTASTLSSQTCQSPPLCTALDLSNPKKDGSWGDEPQDSSSPTTYHVYPRRARASDDTVIIPAPSLRFSRASWWDYLLTTYTIFPVTSNVAKIAVSEISRDVYRFFYSAPIWLTFINVPLFFDTFHHVELRASIQPALILSILAYSKLLQSVQGASLGGFEGREQTWNQSVILRNLAQASFEASYNAGWIDLPLAQAAWILVLYEISSHQDCTLYRMDSSIMLLDAVIRALALTSIDAMDPRAPTFIAEAAPILGRLPLDNTRSRAAQPPDDATDSDFPTLTFSSVLPHTTTATQPHPESDPMPRLSSRCPCHTLSLASSPEVLRSTPFLMYMPRWVPTASWAEIRKEEARRLVWSSVMMLGSDASARQAGGIPLLDLHISKAENFALLYPGEEDYWSLPNVESTHLGKESNWALWGRAMLLWFACLRHLSNGRSGNPLTGFFKALPGPDEDTEGNCDAEFAIQAWMETIAIEEALNDHSCGAEQSMMYQARDCISKIRMQVSGGFRNYIPVAHTGVNFSQPDPVSAMKWLNQAHSSGMAVLTVITGPSDSLGRKRMVDSPFVIFLCVGTTWRALELWKLDDSLSLALEVAEVFRRVFNWYQQIWPSAASQRWAANAFQELDIIRGTLERT